MPEPPLRELTEDERAWIADSTEAMLRQVPAVVAHVGFDDPPDGLLAVLHRERP
jgi:hypothetical protein